jgi:hypothetical protein
MDASRRPWALLINDGGSADEALRVELTGRRFGQTASKQARG